MGQSFSQVLLTLTTANSSQQFTLLVGFLNVPLSQKITHLESFHINQQDRYLLYVDMSR